MDGTASEKIEKVIAIAKQQLGKPYVYATAGPNTFDCSGFTKYCYAKVGVSLRRSAQQVGYNNGKKIEGISNLKRGDIVCFNTVADNDLSDHVGIYLGGGQFIHASPAAARSSSRRSPTPITTACSPGDAACCKTHFPLYRLRGNFRGGDTDETPFHRIYDFTAVWRIFHAIRYRHSRPRRNDHRVRAGHHAKRRLCAGENGPPGSRRGRAAPLRRSAAGGFLHPLLRPDRSGSDGSHRNLSRAGTPSLAGRKRAYTRESLRC